MTHVASAPARTKPRLRGVSHEIAFYVSLVAACALILQAAPGRPTLAAAIYGLCLVALFGISAAYHRPTWSPIARQRMRRLDHAGIFLQIAGSYTPICLLAVPGAAGQRLLALIWVGAALGLVKSLLWVHAPKPLTALLYVILSWAVVGEWSLLVRGVGHFGAWLFIAGGVLYTAGAVIYSRKRPDPWPEVFGYHEIFHLLVIVAAALHFVLIQGVVLKA